MKRKKKFFRNIDGQDLVVEAEYFLFCMGGIENAKFVNKIIDDLNLKKISSKPFKGVKNYQKMKVSNDISKLGNKLSDMK